MEPNWMGAEQTGHEWWVFFFSSFGVRLVRGYLQPPDEEGALGNWTDDLLRPVGEAVVGAVVVAANCGEDLRNDKKKKKQDEMD